MEQFISDYTTAVDDAMIELFGLNLYFYPLDKDIVSGAQEDGWTPEQLAAWHGKNVGMRMFGEPLSPEDHLKLYIALTLRG